MLIEAESVAARCPGRPRSADAHAAILQAAIDELNERGYSQMTIVGVAARSGVAKTTIYRRWPTKDDLVVAVMDAVIGLAAPSPKRGSVRDDLLALVSAIYRTYSGPQSRSMLSVIAASVDNEYLAEAMRARVWEPGRAIFFSVLQHGVATGQLRPDADVETATAMLMAVPAHYTLPGHRTMPDGLAPRVVDAVLQGIVAGAH